MMEKHKTVSYIETDTPPLILLVGPSGSGKSTVADILHEKYGLSVVQSYTTRPQRTPDERGHLFVSKQRFDQLTNLVAYTKFNGYEYCATQSQVDCNDIYIIDPDGISYFRDTYDSNRPYVVVNIYARPSKCFERMIRRGDSEQKATDRINHDRSIYYFPEKPWDFDIKVNSEYTSPQALALCILTLTGYPITIAFNMDNCPHIVCQNNLPILK